MNLPLTVIEPVNTDTQALAIEIADEAAVITIESYARKAALGLWDTSAADPAEIRDESIESVQQDIQRAVRYLDARGLIVRPLADRPQLVSVGGRE